MTKASYLSQPTILRVPNLLQELRDGVIVIPKFQRPYVWTDQQRLELMESIYQGLPIGSLLVWRTHDRQLATYQLRGTKSRENENDKQYLLDGHQRVTTLFTALGAGLLSSEDESNDAPLILDTEDDYREIRPIYFDLEDRNFVLEPRRVNTIKPTLLPLAILFDDLRLYEFQERLLKDRPRTESATLVNRVRILHKTFYDYSIAVVPLIADDLSLVTKSFERVNSAGTPLSEVHMVSALTYIKGFDVNDKVQEIREELGEVGWQDLDEQMILNVCKAQLGIEIYRKDITPLVTRLKKQPTLLDEARDALVLAAEFLARACAIYGPQALPYSYQIVLLADVLQRHEGDVEELDEQLAAWLWMTSYGEYFAAMTSARLRAALKHLSRVAAGKAKPRPPNLSTEILPPGRFDFRAARSRMMALTMAELEPVSSAGKPCDAFSILASHGGHAMPKLLTSKEIGARASEGMENRFLTTPQDLRRLRQALRTRGELTPKQLRSHGIDKDAASALHSGRYPEFLELRRAYLLEVEASYVEGLGLTYVMNP